METQSILPLILLLKSGFGAQKTAPQSGFDFAKMPEIVEKLKSGDVSALLDGLNLDEKTKAMIRMISSFSATSKPASPSPVVVEKETDNPLSPAPNEINRALKKLMDKNAKTES